MAGASPPSQTLIASPADFHWMLGELASEPRVGLDTEFVGEDCFHPELCLVQLAGAKGLFVVDPFRVGDLREMWELLCAPERWVIVHAGREEMRQCHRAIGRIPDQVFDVQFAAGLLGSAFPASHGQIVASYLDVTLVKGETLSNWRLRPLTARQLSYAYDDVRYLLQLVEIMQPELERRGRWSWFEQEMTRWRGTLFGDADREAWRNVRTGGQRLGRRQLAMLKAIYEWRLHVAREKNKPVRYILRDDLMIELAKREPTSINDLTSMRGVSASLAGQILDVADSVRNMSPNDWPHLPKPPPDTPDLAAVTSLLSLAIQELSMREEVAVSLLATPHELKGFVRHIRNNTPLDADALLASGWRQDIVVPLLREILEGRKAIRFRNKPNAPALEWIDIG